MNAILDKLDQAIPGFTPFRALVTREFIDQKGGFITTPMVIGGLLVLLIAGLLLISDYSFIYGHIDGMSFKDFMATLTADQVTAELSKVEPGVASIITSAVILSVASPIFIAAPIVIFFALLSALYDDRKDRSYLFWKSMPVSDTKEVLTKLVTILFFAPLVFVAIAGVVQIAVMVLATVAALVHGWPVVGFMWANTPVVGLWLGLIVAQLVIALWLMPIAGWLLAVSAYAPKTPFLFAVVPPVAVVMIERIFFGSRYAAHWIAGRYEEPLRMFQKISKDLMASSDGPGFSGHFMSLDGAIQALGQSLASPGLWSGLVLGGVLIATAVWLRRYQV